MEKTMKTTYFSFRKYLKWCKKTKNTAYLWAFASHGSKINNDIVEATGCLCTQAGIWDIKTKPTPLSREEINSFRGVILENFETQGEK